MSAAEMDVLFQPLQIGDVTIPNRIGMAAMARNRSNAGNVPSELMKKYYLQRALGGAGLIVSEAVFTSPHGPRSDRMPGIWTLEQVMAWKRITNAVHLARSKMYCQLWHMGRLSDPDAQGNIFAPSPIRAVGGEHCFQYLTGAMDFSTPREIPNPRVFVNQFKTAAIHAKAAGFDGVELHACSGFLVHQFLDSKSNIRTDEWGGSPQNRARFPLEVLQALVEVFGNNVGVKISPCGGFNDMGMPLQETIETFGYFVREADKLGLAYISLMRYDARKDPIINGQRRGTPHDLLATYLSHISPTSKMKVFVVGDVVPAEAAALVQDPESRVDGVFFGVPWVAHPDLAKRIRHGKGLGNIVREAYFYDGADANDQAEAKEDLRVGYTDYVAVTY
ncbi:Oxidored-FMN domain-containing protein [Mycena kentingensis (nom. inval.)]|nr:Oxidored-FMN domain-containing protein [Mycena kentingensis (nom. inval.)]